MKKGVLGNFAKSRGKHVCQSLFLNKVAGLNEALAQVFSCEFWKISKNTFSTEHIETTASGALVPRKWYLATIYNRRVNTLFLNKKCSYSPNIIEVTLQALY